MSDHERYQPSEEDKKYFSLLVELVFDKTTAGEQVKTSFYSYLRSLDSATGITTLFKLTKSSALLVQGIQIGKTGNGGFTITKLDTIALPVVFSRRMLGSKAGDYPLTDWQRLYERINGAKEMEDRQLYDKLSRAIDKKNMPLIKSLTANLNQS